MLIKTVYIYSDLFDVTVVSPRSYFFYTPLLAGTATGTVSPSSIMEPIRWYCGSTGETSSGVNFIQAECIDVDIANKKLSVAGLTSPVKGFSLAYDHLVISVGAEPATFNIPGVKEYAYFMKEIEDGMKFKRQILQKLETASTMIAAGASMEEVEKQLHWVIIGGGPTGVELTAELTDFVQQDVKKYFPVLAGKVRLTLMEATGRLLVNFL